jgi:hypothetical protein
MSPFKIDVEMVLTVLFSSCSSVFRRQRGQDCSALSVYPLGTLEAGQTSPQFLSSLSMGLMTFHHVGAALMFSTNETSSL